MSSVPRTFRLNFVGDVMLGRLIDQLFPTHVHEPSEAAHIATFAKGRPFLQNYNAKSPWGSTLPLFAAGDLNLVNLETSATTHSVKWPNKVFNYRMHPANIVALKEARVDYASLANNHTLDFCEEGLLETVRTLKSAGIAFAGAGETADEARRPAVLKLPRDSSSSVQQHEIHVYSASDHPRDWNIDCFHLIDYSASTRERLKIMLNPPGLAKPALKIFSVHWGPNYDWTPNRSIQSLAHFLVDECGVNIIHGHSSHHVQGVEKYNGALIIYGCGDFVDDYAVDEEYRNNMSAMWSVIVEERPSDRESSLKLKRLDIYPTAIRSFQALILEPGVRDHDWVTNKIRTLSSRFGTRMQTEPAGDGQLVLDLRDNN
jgi:poly-gamma-glutamate capsule biosynthesis protein CapA/YwtB (metallophosphatase superfamily)